LTLTSSDSDVKKDLAGHTVIIKVQRTDFLITHKEDSFQFSQELREQCFPEFPSWIRPDYKRFCENFTLTFIEEHRGAGVAVGHGQIKELTAMETYKKQKVVATYASFCSATMLTSKIRREIERPCSVSGCVKSCNKFASSW